MMTTDESLFDGEVRCFDGDKHNNPIPLDDDHDVIPPLAPHPALPCPSYLFVILSCFSKAVICPAPYEHRRPHMSIPVQYSTPGLLTAAHTLHVHPTHTETPAMKTCSQILHHPTWSRTAHILHTGTPAMKSCSLRISANCPTFKVDTIYMLVS